MIGRIPYTSLADSRLASSTTTQAGKHQRQLLLIRADQCGFAFDNEMLKAFGEFRMMIAGHMQPGH